MYTTLEIKIDEEIKCIIETVQLAVKWGNPELKKPEVYITLVEDLFRLKSDINKSKQLQESLPEMTEIEELDEFVSKFSVEEVDIKEIPEFKQLVEQINRSFSEYNAARASTSSNCTGNDDEIVIASTVSYNDPISKRKIEHPLKNIICNHHYDKTTILEAIQIHPNLRCPVVGCGNKDPVEESCLEEDVAFLVQLQSVTHAS